MHHLSGTDRTDRGALLCIDALHCNAEKTTERTCGGVVIARVCIRNEDVCVRGMLRAVALVLASVFGDVVEAVGTHLAGPVALELDDGGLLGGALL